MSPTSPHSRLTVAMALIGATAAVGCGTSGAATLPTAPRAPGAAAPIAVSRPARVATVASASAPVDRLTHEARLRYNEETSGRQVHAQLRRVARDQTLRRLLASGNTAALRTYVNRVFARTWYHWHVSRVRIVRGSRVVAGAGVPFVVAPATQTLRDARGRPLARLEVSIQDVIGFVRYMHRNFPVDIVVRGRGATHVKTSLPAARFVALPSRGTVSISGRRYQVRSFARHALGNEPVTVWVLVRTR